MGYRESAPADLLAQIDPVTVSTYARRAIGHAEANTHIAKDFMENCPHQRFYDIDAAVCLYHAAQIVSFAAHSRFYEVQEAAPAIDRCLQFLESFCSSSEFAKPMIRDLEALVQRSMPSSRPGESNQYIDSSGVADIALAAPKLSIHSLLRRADFPEVDEAETRLDNGNSSQHVNDDDLRSMMDTDFPFDPWMGWQGSLDPFGYLQLSENDLY
jgi:hypothetical protein